MNQNPDPNDASPPGSFAANPYAPPAYSTAADADASAEYVGADAATLAGIRSSGAWFFWIAGLSLVNSVILLAGGNWNFVVGLGVTQLIDAVAHQLQDVGSAAVVVAAVLDLLAAAVFIALGLFTRRLLFWPFVVGMVLYALDGLLLFSFGDLLGTGFHVFVLLQLFSGAKAVRALHAGTA